ncbi:hypothetical protein KEJ45_03100 [Candidatus Bathyarchaeota archaeon]|nr:hypothetical protein [Candidatus Bathyarchaeota archaeon]
MIGFVGNVILKSELRLLKLKAQRNGVWFKVLSSLDRTLINLTLKVTDAVRGSKLAEALLKIRDKVKMALKDRITQAILRVGLPLARRIISLAKSWGNPHAENWFSDFSFARFLAITWINSKPGGVSYTDD